MKHVSITTVVFLCVLASSMAQAPGMINYQGRLVDTNGVAVTNATVTLGFTIYTNILGGAVYTYTTNDVPVANGLYSVMIGVTNYPSLTNALTANVPPFYLGVSVNSIELVPRTQLASVPYALKAEGLTGEGTNLNASNLNSGNLAEDRLTNALYSGTSYKINATNLNGNVNLTNTVGILPNGSAPAAIAASTLTGNVDEDRVTNALYGGTAYKINATNLNGLVPLVNMRTDIPASSLDAGTTASAIDGYSITNLNATNIVGNMALGNMPLVGISTTITIICESASGSTNVFSFTSGILTNHTHNP